MRYSIKYKVSRYNVVYWVVEFLGYFIVLRVGSFYFREIKRFLRKNFVFYVRFCNEKILKIFLMYFFKLNNRLF